MPRSVVPSSAGKGWGRHCKASSSAEECRVVPSSAGKGWGRHWGAFKLLYYHCNTTKIDRVEQPRTVCGAEDCRVVPRSAE